MSIPGLLRANEELNIGRLEDAEYMLQRYEDILESSPFAWQEISDGLRGSKPYMKVKAGYYAGVQYFLLAARIFEYATEEDQPAPGVRADLLRLSFPEREKSWYRDAKKNFDKLPNWLAVKAEKEIDDFISEKENFNTFAFAAANFIDTIRLAEATPEGSAERKAVAALLLKIEKPINEIDLYHLIEAGQEIRINQTLNQPELMDRLQRTLDEVKATVFGEINVAVTLVHNENMNAFRNSKTVLDTNGCSAAGQARMGGSWFL